MPVEFGAASRALLFAIVAVVAGGCQNPDPELTAAAQRGVDNGYPGVAAVYRRSGAAPVFAAAGLADIEKGVRLTPRDCFHIGSITKTFTAVAALQLIDEGELSPDAKLTDVLPAALVGRIPYADQIAVRHLIDHSSGIYATNNDLVYLGTILGEGADPAMKWTPEQFVARAYAGVNEPAAAPGEGHHYSDTNYILLGLVVEGAAGRPLKEIVSERIFGPLRMTSTYFNSDYLGPDADPPAECVRGYMRASEDIRAFIKVSPIFKAVPGRTIKGDEILDTTLAAERIDAAAGIISTLPDLLKYAEALFAGRLLSADSQALLMEAQTGMELLPVGESTVAAMQSAHKPFGVIVYKQGDGPGGTSAVMAYHPQSATIFIGFTNSFGHFDEADFLLDDLMAAAVGAG